MRICRADDGSAFNVHETAADIERKGNLNLILGNITGVPQDCVLAYLSNGHRLTDDNFHDTITSSDQSIFVYNKSHLEGDVESALKTLHVTPSSAPSFKDLPLSESADKLLEWMSTVKNSVQIQLEALRIASSSLDLNVLSISDIYETFAEAAQTELQQQDQLLTGIDIDLGVISRVKISPEFLSAAARKSQDNGERSRTLGDYVSNAKMKQVAENCTTLHSDLTERFQVVDESFQALVNGSEKVRKSISQLKFLDEAELCIHRLGSIADNLETPHPNGNVRYRDLRLILIATTGLKGLHQSIQIEILELCRVKNQATEQCIITLREISTLNVDLISLPPTLSTLQTDFRARNSFSHIQRLHNMLYAYGATLIELIKKFTGGFFNERANIIAEMMAKLTAGEKKRRQIYRSDIQGLMPFDIRGLEDIVPSVELTLSGPETDQLPSLGRGDLERFFDEIGRIEQSIISLDPNIQNSQPFQEVRDAWSKLVSRMDNLETSFDRVAERASAIFDHPSYQQAMDQVKELERTKSEIEAQFLDHRHSLEDEIDRLRGELHDATETVAQDEEQLQLLKTECTNLREQLGYNGQDIVDLQQQRQELQSEVKSLNKTMDIAQAEARSKTREADLLKIELTQIQAEHREMKVLEEKNAAHVASVLSDQQATLQNLDEARLRGENLETQIQAALSEGNEARRALQDVTEEKERLLRTQASEHDRRLRDHIAEADGDRAVLEQQFFELRSELDAARSGIDRAHADLSGVKEELQRTVHELAEGREAEQTLRAELKSARILQSETETRSEHSQRLVAEILQVAINYQHALGKAASTAQSAASYPSKPQAGVADSMISTDAKPAIFPGQNTAELTIDPTEPENALELLRDFDLDVCAEVLAKPISVLRKWQRQCKDYRERAKSKITFRNFAKGDLALFLPIKNSQQKPWAAFNVAFPHYFLQATGQIADQLKSREWIVARITSISEKIASNQDHDSNPYGLSDGIKFYMCQVEDWSQPSARRNAATPQRSVSGDQVARASSHPPTVTADIVPLETTAPETILNADTTLYPPTGDPELDALEPSPSSHLFPSRPRTQSASPSRVRPSSLSKLLAQASAVENTPEDKPSDDVVLNEEKPVDVPPANAAESPPTQVEPIETPTPAIPIPIPTIPPSPRRQSARDRAVSNSLTSSNSPRGPRSRASSSSTYGRKFVLPLSSPLSSSPKATATTALSRGVDGVIQSRSQEDSSFAGSSASQGRLQSVGSGNDTPSPADSAGEGMISSITALRDRRRTPSGIGLKVPGSTALGNLASSLGIPIGVKDKKTPNAAVLQETNTSGTAKGDTFRRTFSGSPSRPQEPGTSSGGASDLLRKLDQDSR